MDVNLVWIALSAFGGGILSGVFGWLDSHEAFVASKFMRTVGAALIAAIVFAVAYQFSDGIDVRDVFLAILGGAGVDVLANRALGATISALRT